ncbi:oxidoreductase-like domain-containing protein [Candidatus Burkholderia verschuerenii]|uniref:oxidoreductase-like domain-containing protein n=1 Tax=Candidatus Burkholderia verschuerenii TaxID=242163 RepID=UPI00351A5E2E
MRRRRATERPLPGECCQSGCNPCVFDLYDEAMARYEADLAAWKARHGERPDD